MGDLCGECGAYWDCEHEQQRVETIRVWAEGALHAMGDDVRHMRVEVRPKHAARLASYAIPIPDDWEPLPDEGDDDD